MSETDTGHVRPGMTEQQAQVAQHVAEASAAYGGGPPYSVPAPMPNDVVSVYLLAVDVKQTHIDTHHGSVECVVVALRFGALSFCALRAGGRACVWVAALRRAMNEGC